MAELAVRSPGSSPKSWSTPIHQMQAEVVLTTEEADAPARRAACCERPDGSLPWGLLLMSSSAMPWSAAKTKCSQGAQLRGVACPG